MPSPRVLAASILLVVSASTVVGQTVRKSPFHPAKPLVAKATVEFVDTPLVDACKFLSTKHGIPITVNEKSLNDIGLPKDEPVNLAVKDVTLASLLELLTEPLGLTWRESGRGIEILGVDDDEENVTAVVYDVSSLGGVAPDVMINLVTSVVAPDTWQDVGGQGAVQAQGARLSVRQSGKAHRELTSLLRQLDRAVIGARRNKPTAAELGEAAIRRKLAGEKITLHLVDVPLQEAVAKVSASAKLPFVVDRVSLEEAGIALDEPITANLNGPLATSLDGMLKPIDASWYVKDEVVHVASRNGAEDAMDVRVYEVAHLLRGGANAFAANVQQRTGEDHWIDSGGPGAIVVVGRYAVIRQSAPLHRELAVLLAKR